MRYDARKHRLPICDVSGVLLVDKPKEWTSFDVVNFVRSRFNVPKVGHCGTLDPAATGLLVLMLGAFTRRSERFTCDDKTYEGTLKLGTVTDSGDLDGTVIRESDCSGVSDEMLRDAYEYRSPWNNRRRNRNRAERISPAAAARSRSGAVRVRSPRPFSPARRAFCRRP